MFSYTVLVNGEPTSVFQPCCGIKQGDLLILICAKGFIVLLRQMESSGPLLGVFLYDGSTSISHLLFAYDNLLFIQAKEYC